MDRRVLKEFLAQADETNDVFRLAAKLVAGVALRAAALLDGKLRSQRQRLAAEGAGSGSAAAGDGAEEEEAVLRREALREAWLPYAAGWKGKWWEAVAAPDDVRGADAEAEFRQQLRCVPRANLHPECPSCASMHPCTCVHLLCCVAASVFRCEKVTRVLRAPMLACVRVQGAGGGLCGAAARGAARRARRLAGAAARRRVGVGGGHV